MPDRRGATLRDLREAVDCLPRATRVAMLDGIDRNPIIVGAYTDAAGICPMLAAHRGGGRTSFIGFARAWDSFAFRDARNRRARRATKRELLVLRSYLEASLLADDCPDGDLARAAAEHRELIARRPVSQLQPALKTPQPSQTRPGDPDHAPRLRRRPGWRWMRVVRSLEDYERTLAALEQECTAAEVAAPLPD